LWLQCEFKSFVFGQTVAVGRSLMGGSYTERCEAAQPLLDSLSQSDSLTVIKDHLSANLADEIKTHVWYQIKSWMGLGRHNKNFFY